MRKGYTVSVPIPKEISCDFKDEILKCKKKDVETSRKISILGTEVKISDGKVSLICRKANKKNVAMIKTNASHIRNMLKGFEDKFVYEMEICHVHFPITTKVEENRVIIGNFLGEKVDRSAKILEDVEVEIKGQKILISGNSIEKVGQTAANIEKAAIVKGRDKRIFQDGIFITSKPGGII